MLIENPKSLPDSLKMQCYACEERPATHLCRYRVGDLVVQICLCANCMKIDTKRLLENTIGIQGELQYPAFDDVSQEGLRNTQSELITR